MTPKKFLETGGVVLILLAMLGIMRPHLAGPFLTFTPAENWGHLFLGILAVLLAPMPIGDLKQWIVMLIGVLGIFTAIVGYMMRNAPFPNFYGFANFEHPVDTVLHAVIGVWAMLAAFGEDRRKR